MGAIKKQLVSASAGLSAVVAALFPIAAGADTTSQSQVGSQAKTIFVTERFTDPTTGADCTRITEETQADSKKAANRPMARSTGEARVVIFSGSVPGDAAATHRFSIKIPSVKVAAKLRAERMSAGNVAITKTTNNATSKPSDKVAKQVTLSCQSSQSSMAGGGGLAVGASFSAQATPTFVVPPIVSVPGEGISEVTLPPPAAFVTGAGAAATTWATADIPPAPLVDYRLPPLPAPNYSFNTGAVHVAPIPEPSTYALMAVGLGIVAWMARRRRSSVTPS